MRAWWRLLRRYHFAVDLRYVHIAVFDTLASVSNSVLGAIEQRVYARRLRATPADPDLLFVLGHWRTGTTLLHELLALDPRAAAPTVYQCLAPHHFLLTERFLPRLLWMLVPNRRPMDDMAFGWDSPFEDDFALCLMGARSPAETIAFPNAPRQTRELLEVRTLPDDDVQTWRETMLAFVRKLALRQPQRRLVLKSPVHTCRVRLLLELFPQARFVHIVRDPVKVFASSKHLFRTMVRTQGLQRLDEDGFEEAVLSTFEFMHACFERDRPLLAPGQLHELRYEDLVRDPPGAIRALYANLGLAYGPQLDAAIKAYIAARADYRTNSYMPSAADRAIVGRRWAPLLARYGYDCGAEPAAQAGVTRRASSAATSWLCGGASTSK